MKSTANRTRPRVINAGMVGLIECCGWGIAVRVELLWALGFGTTLAFMMLMWPWFRSSMHGRAAPMKRTSKPPHYLARAFSDEVDSGWRGKGRRPISCAYSAADKPARSAKLHCRVHPQIRSRACFCGIPACLAKPCLAKQGRLLATGPLLGFDGGNRGHVENAARGHRGRQNVRRTRRANQDRPNRKRIGQRLDHLIRH